MEFRRVEVRKVLRHREDIHDKDEVRKILQALYDNNISFIAKVSGHGAILKKCHIMQMTKDGAQIFCGSHNVRMSPSCEEFKEIEVEANCEFECELDEDGRWSHIIVDKEV